MRSLFWVVLAVSACSPPEVGIDLVTSPALSPLVRESVRFIGDPRLAVHDTGEPLARPRSISITVEERSDCTECYRLERRGSQLVVNTSDLAPGAYTFRLSDDKGVVSSFKVVIAH